MEIYNIPKPDISKISQEKVIKIITGDFGERTDFLEFYNKTISPTYLYWDKIQYKPTPKGYSKEEFWSAVKFMRNLHSQKTPIISENGQNFKLLKLPELEKFLHNVDLNMGGNLFMYNTDIDEKSRYRFISRGIMEEAIASSQLEGANTTRQAAKKLLLEGRKPKDISEMMIVNNHEAMQALESDYKSKDISISGIFELHAILTKDILPIEEQGTFRTDEDKIVVDDKDTGYIYHIAPKIDFVQKQLKILVAFANDETSENFIHPLVKAIMLHFWIGYLHPFTDGNGRLARLIFYWYLLKNNYWAFSYLPISKVIKKSAIAYGQAYLYTEQDDFDITYFIDYNIKKIKIAIDDFETYLKEKASENAQMNKLSKSSHNFNERQIQLLQYLSLKTDESTTVKSHMTIHRITKATAIKDLKKLESENFLKTERRGKYVYYSGTNNILRLFSKK